MRAVGHSGEGLFDRAFPETHRKPSTPTTTIKMLEWTQFVPLSRIHCEHDAHSLEEAVGSALVVREILDEILPDQ